MPLLEDHEIRELYSAVLTAGLTDSRGALMAGIDGTFVAGLAIGTSPADQVMRDLNALSGAGALLDGKVPLHTWLANAAQFAGPRRESAVFTRYRDRVAPQPGGGQAAAAAANAAASSAALTEDQVLDALGKMLPAMFETFLFKLKVPTGYLSGTGAPQMTRAIEVLRWAQGESRLDDVRRVLAEVRGGPPANAR